MRKVELNVNEQYRYEVIKKLVETNGNKDRAAKKLNCSRRTIDRLILKYKREGKIAFRHKNHDIKPVSTIPTDIRNSIVVLYENKYTNANIRHFTEKLNDKENIKISESSVRNILMEQNILSPKAHKSTKKALKIKLQKAKSDEKSKKKQIDIQNTIDHIDMEPHSRRERCAFFGEMLQMDASPHVWFGQKSTMLHAAIDDATGAITGAFFDTQETLNGYYNVFKQVLMDYGIPYMFYTDRRTVFDYKRSDEKDVSKNTLTQFGYACKQLGVDLKVTSIPQAKGRVERLFETLQSRLPIELRLAGVETIEQANEFLKSYLNEFNAKFALPTNCIKSVFENQPEEEKINLILSVITTRKIDNGACIKYQNSYYKLFDKQGKQICFCKGTEVTVIKSFDGNMYAQAYDNIYILEKMNEHELTSRYFNTKKEQEAAKLVKGRYIPNMNHPWKKDNFMKYVMAYYGKEERWASNY